jgi:hypothetical protein
MDMLCLSIDSLDPPFELTLPGGVDIEHLNLMEVIQPALTPLIPIFQFVDFAVAAHNCLQATPDAIKHMDPSALTACLPDLAKKMEKLLRLLPLLSLPILLVRLLDLVIDTLCQARDKFTHLQAQLTQIQSAVNRAKELADAGLMAIAQCAHGNVEQEAANVGASLASMGKLIGLINLFLGMIGVSPIPDLSGLSGKPLDQVIEPLDELVEVLRGVRDSIPVPHRRQG